MLAYDGSPGARKALETAVDLAGSLGSDLLAVTVEAHLPRYAATVGEVEEERAAEESQATTSLAEATGYARGHGIVLETEVRAGNAAHAIVQAAKEHGVDLIVLGASGRSGLWGHFLGGTADRVSEHAPCAVLIAR